MTHNALVGRVPLMARLDQPTLSCELTFDAPQTPGEYKVMVHVRSAGCVGVDVRRKVVFNVQRSKRALPSSSSGASTEEPDTMNEPIEGDEVPPLEGAERPGAGDEPPPLIAEEPLDAAQAAERRRDCRGAAAQATKPRCSHWAPTGHHRRLASKRAECGRCGAIRAAGSDRQPRAKWRACPRPADALTPVPTPTATCYPS